LLLQSEWANQQIYWPCLPRQRCCV
jgi:hypothetical protein